MTPLHRSLPWLSAVASLVVAACAKSGPEPVRTRPAPLVVAAKVMTRDVPVEVHAPVELRPLAQSDVGSKTLGYLDAVLVDRGDKVRRGQTIALVRPSDLPDQLTAARGTLAQVGASLALARTNADRAQQLAPSGVVSQQELQNSLGALAQAEAQQSAAQGQVAAIATRIGETRIDSPLDGVVAVRRLDPGALVGPPGGGAIVTIVKIDVLRVFITVTERDLAGVRVGRDAHVELEAFPGRRITGKVVRVSPTLDPTTRTLDAEVQIPNPDELLRPGMFGRGSIVLDVHPHVPVIPAAAIQLTDGKPFVYVVVGGSGDKGGDKVQRRAIETGADGGDWLEVKSGLKEGEDLVTAGIDGLSDGATVRVTRGIDPYSGVTRAEDRPKPAGSVAPPPSSRD